MDQIIIGKFIAEERKRKGYTQKQLSEKLGISDNVEMVFRRCRCYYLCVGNWILL